jgi:hypothetical protein
VLRGLDALERDSYVSIVHVDRIACNTARFDYIMGGKPIFADHGDYSPDFARRLRSLFAEAVRSANARPYR